jgi:hypothetical protein
MWIVALAATLVAPIGVEKEAQAVAASTVTTAQIHSKYETAKRSISRDIGISAQLPDGHQLWLFGDTGIWNRDASGKWHQGRFIPGSTAMLAKGARGQVPSGGELPSGSPAIFLPTPHNVYLPDGSGKPCVFPDARFAARWPTGIAVVPSNKSRVLITYGEVCVTKTSSSNKVGVRAEGWGYLLYNWRAKKIEKIVDVFKPKSDGSAIPPQQIYGWPMFAAGHITMFSSQCTSSYVNCNAGRVGAVTLSSFAALDNPSAYTLKQMVTDGTSLWTPLAISVGRYPSGLRLIETTSITGSYKLFSASQPTGPWHLLRSGTVPGCPSKKRFCFALEGHPELSTANNLIVSYHDPDSGPGGHIVVSAIPD